MQIVSVNVGGPREIATKSGKSAIFKEPQSDAVHIGELGLEGDSFVDTKVHGGADKAVYLYGQPDYDFWAGELDRELAPGLFGENLTVAGLESAGILIGDRFAIGDVLLEVTSPRSPCSTFAARMQDKKWVKRFHAARRPGVYARVLKTGNVKAGDSARHIRFDGEPIPVTELMNDYQNPSADRMRWLLKAPLHSEFRTQYEARLREIDAQQAQRQ